MFLNGVRHPVITNLRVDDNNNLIQNASRPVSVNIINIINLPVHVALTW